MLIFALVYTLVMTAMMIGMGFVFIKMPTKEITEAAGYHSKRAMKNQKNWKFAQQASAKYLIRNGIANFIFSIGWLVVFKQHMVYGLIVIELILFLSVIPITEYAIKNYEKK